MGRAKSPTGLNTRTVNVGERPVLLLLLLTATATPMMHTSMRTSMPRTMAMTVRRAGVRGRMVTTTDWKESMTMTSTRATTVTTTVPEKTTFPTVIGPVTLLCTDRDDGF